VRIESFPKAIYGSEVFVNQMSGISGKSAVVTGAGHGIGRAIALELAKEGAKVMVSDIDGESAAAVALEIQVAGGVSHHSRADVGSSESIGILMTKTVGLLGGIDILVNNAGITSTCRIVDLSEEEWDRTLDVNLRSVFLCTRAAAKQMISQGEGGRIVNIASEAGKAAYAGAAHYCASKAGIIAFTRSAALELAPYQITVNSVCPGNVDTEFFHNSLRAEAKMLGVTYEQRLGDYMKLIPLGRLEKPEDVAHTVVFLCSTEAGYITGEDLNVTGGSTMY
jgi:NAD(P)-dependent dehydrogenase (short-subunit alcohol dehydrogenase family)